MSGHNTSLVPEVLPPRRPRGLWAAALAAALGGALGATAVGFTAWHFVDGQLARQAAAVPEVAISPVVVPPVEIDIAPPAPAPLTGRAGFIIHGDGPMVSLAADPPDEWQRGTPALIDSDDFSRTLRRQVSDAVPAEHRALVGSRIVAVDQSGARCEVTVGELSVIGVYYAEMDEPETAAQRTEAWGYTSPTLAAALSVPEHCGELAWAVIPASNGGGELRTFAVDTQPALGPALQTTFRALAGWTRIQNDYKTYDSGDWDEHASRTFAVIGGAERGLAIASAVSGSCEAGGHLTAIWEVRDGQLGGAVAVPEDVALTEIVAAADLNGDGLPEILYRDDRLGSGVLVSEDGGYANVDGPEIVSLICPC